MNPETSEINIQNETSSQGDQITQLEDRSNEISQSNLLQSPLSLNKEGEPKDEAKMMTRLKEIDEILEKRPQILQVLQLDDDHLDWGVMHSFFTYGYY